MSTNFTVNVNTRVENEGTEAETRIVVADVAATRALSATEYAEVQRFGLDQEES